MERAIDRVNLNQLRVFEAVFRAGGMSVAAKTLGMTQSAVSQHIRTLEDSIGVPLFERANQKLIPTAAASILYPCCETGLQEFDDVLSSLTHKKSELAGNISLGTPPEFGEAVLAPILSQLLKKHPKLQVRVRVGQPSELVEMIIRREVDFAFVDSWNRDKRLNAHRVYEERIELCASPKLLDRIGTPRNAKSFYEKLDYVGYLEGEPFLRNWFKHHLKSSKISLNVRAYAMSCQNVARMIAEGVGVGVLPGQLLSARGKTGFGFYTFEGSGKPLINHICLAYLDERQLPPRAIIAMNWLRSSLKKWV